MEICPYLAMTAGELGGAEKLPEHLAYMACHFSPYSTGLSNIPGTLPPGSILMVNDRTPICGHDPQRICAELTEAVEKLSCRGILLDFQRPDFPETARLCKHLVQTRNCPTCVSHLYAQDLPCPILIPPAPLHTPLEEHLAKWQGREIWLEIATDAACIRLTKEGASLLPDSYREQEEYTHTDEHLHIDYHIEQQETQVLFHLRRTPHHLANLLRQAQSLGITTALGLYQQLPPGSM